MTKDDYKTLVEKLDRNDRAMLEEAKRLGTATASDLRPVTRAPKTGKPMEYGLTRELRRLQEKGLLRQVDKTPARYAAVPVAEVEDAAERYAQRTIRKKKRKTNRSRMADLRAYETGDYAEFYRVHRRVIELGEFVGVQIRKMAYWRAAPKDELAQVAAELISRRAAIDDAMVCLKERADDDETLARIEKLEATDGRTGPEADQFRETAERLRRQYDLRVGF
jgi:sugar-specific transcriptional regulator TrmB